MGDPDSIIPRSFKCVFTEQCCGPIPGLGDVGYIAVTKPVHCRDSYIRQTITASSIRGGDEGS